MISLVQEVMMRMLENRLRVVNRDSTTERGDIVKKLCYLKYSYNASFWALNLFAFCDIYCTVTSTTKDV